RVGWRSCATQADAIATLQMARRHPVVGIRLAPRAARILLPSAGNADSPNMGSAAIAITKLRDKA
ncbi:MAG TPA: hypothetical protein VG755_07195, partial [Nannocystaceae bacterium]|nr:hypothetical protein [Nannocystaceae bacterium]